MLATCSLTHAHVTVQHTNSHTLTHKQHTKQAGGRCFLCDSRPLHTNQQRRTANFENKASNTQTHTHTHIHIPDMHTHKVEVKGPSLISEPAPTYIHIGGGAVDNAVAERFTENNISTSV
jgi:hypothetical protein